VKKNFFIKIAKKILELEPVPEPELELPQLEKAVPELELEPAKFWNFCITVRKHHQI